MRFGFWFGCAISEHFFSYIKLATTLRFDVHAELGNCRAQDLVLLLKFMQFQFCMEFILL